MSDGFYDDVPEELLRAPTGKPRRPTREAPQNAATLLLIASLFPVAVLGFPAIGVLVLASGATSVGPPPDPTTLDTQGTQASLELPERNLALDFERVTLVRGMLRAELPDGAGTLHLVCGEPLEPGARLTPYDWLGGDPPTLELPARNLVLLAEAGAFTVVEVVGETVGLELTGTLQVFGVQRFEDAQTSLRTRAATGAQAPRGGKTTPFTLTATARYAP